MNTLRVVYHHAQKGSLPLGRLAYKQGIAYLEFEADFLSLGLNLSPLQLKLNTQLQIAQRSPFQGLHGVFADSLPDGWGLLLMDRYFRQQGLSIAAMTPLARLAYMGDRAMGALSYQPDIGNDQTHQDALVLNTLAQDALAVYQGSTEEVAQYLRIIGGSPGGARPKAIIGLKGEAAITDNGTLPIGYEHWLVKFPTAQTKNAQVEGAVEYVYALLARKAGIQFPETRLISTHEHAGFFACKRFDRGLGQQRIHMHSLAGMINADYRVPDADYELLMKATSHITKSHQDLCEVLRRMIFNILSGNRDDHTKNFSYLMDAEGEWLLSPAYDMTFNHGINGQHSMAIMGHGENIPKAAIQAIADLIPLAPAKVDNMIAEIIDALSYWQTYAKEYSVPAEIIAEIEAYKIGAIKCLT